MDSDNWRGIEVGICYIAEGKFQDSEDGRKLAHRFRELLQQAYPDERVYFTSPYKR